MNTPENPNQNSVSNHPAENASPSAEAPPVPTPSVQPDAIAQPPVPIANPNPPIENPSPAGPDAPAEKPKQIAISSALGKAHVLTDVEFGALMACEEVIGTSWSAFVQVGLALGQIRDERLYRADFETFEAYCRLKWQYGRHYVNRLISASQVFNHLVTNCHQTKPEHESQVRPLIGLTTEQATAAWAKAVEKAAGGKRRITAAIVKSALHELQIGPAPAGEPKPPRLSRAEQRRVIDRAVGELLVLLSQHADHKTLTEKVEALHGQIQGLFRAS